jgi:copper chaperone CopZ
MKNLLLTFALALFLAPSVIASEQEVTMTFFMTGLECPSCVYTVTSSISDVKGVSEVKLESILDGFANVTFDSRKASAHQIAQAVTDAYALHGTPYSAVLKLRIPDYAKNDNAAKVDAVFAAQKNLVKLVVIDRAKGEFFLSFQPLKVDAAKKEPQGLVLQDLLAALTKPHPLGLGLTVEVVQEVMK